jgi:hypothetical protein
MIRNFLLTTLLACCACVLGDQATPLSPYESAYFETASASAVSDGLSPIRVLVHGDPGATLTLQVSGAEFLGSSPDENSLTEMTVQLLEVDDEGNASSEVQLVSRTPGLALLAFKLAPLAATLELEFLPIEVEVGAALPFDLRPGQVVHEICLYANTDRGILHTTATKGAIFPARVELEPAGESACGGGENSWQGSAMIEWSSLEAESRLEVAYIGSSEEALPTTSRQVQGEVFPGYSATLHEVEIAEDWASIRTELRYLPTDSLASKVAASVPLQDLRSVPQGLKLVGSSSGSQTALPETDAAGMVTLYFEYAENAQPLSVFATPLGGGTTYLGEIGAP